MADKSWKAFERRIAKAAKGRRIPVTGERHGADVVSELFVYQVKLRKSLPAQVWDWLDGIRRAAKDGQTGVLVLKRPRQRDAQAAVVLAFGDWQALHGDAGELRVEE